jgi:cob(I)alamin adenosyltransferase
MEKQGMLHLYMGNGKGKTTAATGLAVRALGHGFRVLFAQFLKNTETGEKKILENYPDKLLFFRPVQRNAAFLWNMTEEQLAQTKEDIRLGWENLNQRIQTGLWDLVVLDEILDCIQCGLLEEGDVLKAISGRPGQVEMVCTGRKASQTFCDLADYISVIDAVKHPYTKGMQARRGIEF